MCQNYGHSDLTLDLIINRNSAAASASCQMQRRKGFEVIWSDGKVFEHLCGNGNTPECV